MDCDARLWAQPAAALMRQDGYIAIVGGDTYVEEQERADGRWPALERHAKDQDFRVVRRIRRQNEDGAMLSRQRGEPGQDLARVRAQPRAANQTG